MPVASWLRTFHVSWLRWDLTAGVTTAAVVIPQAMAYASIAGLPVEYGLYTALVPMVVYSLLGRARCISVSTTSTIALLTASGIALAPEGAEPPKTRRSSFRTLPEGVTAPISESTL